jgi:hypothetical protein
MISNIIGRTSIIFYVCLSLFSCTNNSGQEEALNSSGSNRFELERVFVHYSKESTDSEKYRAAVFLISNMIDKYSLDSASVANNQPYFDALRDYYLRYGWYLDAGQYPIADSVKASLPKIRRTQFPQQKQDIRTLKSDFLIRHIERSFETRQKFPWAKNLSFVNFCRFVLPYKSHNSLWDGVFDYYRSTYSYLSDSLSDVSASEIGNFIYQDVREHFCADGNFFKKFPFLLPINFRNVVQAHIGECRDMNGAAIAALRSVGIPAALNMLPCWGNSNGRHFWTEIPAEDAMNTELYDNTQRLYQQKEDILVSDMFWENKTVCTDDLPDNIILQSCRTVPKVYREGYEIQQSSLSENSFEEIPEFFTNRCLEDITDKYVVCQDVKIELHNSENRKVAYLCCYDPDNLSWEPVQLAEIKQKKATFKKMGINVLYIPAFYENGVIIPAGDPFILQPNGRNKTLKPIISKTQKAELYTKMPYRSVVMYWAQTLVGCTLGLSYKPDTLYAKPVVTIDKTPFYKKEIMLLEQVKNARYAFFMFSNNKPCFIAELSFFGINEKEKEIEIKGKPFGNQGEYGHEIEKVFDGNRLSYFTKNYNDVPYIGIDFGKPVTIRKIVCLPRNDDNGIVSGEQYELFYWNNEWKSLGKQTGNIDNNLVYDNVPYNSLLRIHNHTIGKEHRPFIIENGKQVFY